MTTSRVLCSKCVGDSILKQWIEAEGLDGECSFCKTEGKVVLFSLVADRVDEVVRIYYAPAAAKPHVVEWSDNTEWWTEGRQASEVIAEIAEMDLDIAEAIEALLSKQEHWDVHRDGAPAYYSDELEMLHPSAGEFLDKWIAFEERLMHEVRFFDDVGKAMLDDLLQDVITIADGRSVVEIEPDSEFAVFYRARMLDDEAEAERVMKVPAVHLGPPPRTKARAGRMNPFGVPAFYGAFAPDVAIAEIRPPVGALVAVGSFRPVRTLRLLDLSFLPHVYHFGSFFSPDFGAKRNKVRFLKALHRRISRPVLPDDEALQYLPTQAVAAYVHNVLKLDGVIYEAQQVVADRADSGQAKRIFCNIALFGGAAKVQQPPRPKMPPPDLTDPFIASQFGRTAPDGSIIAIEEPEPPPEPFTLIAETPTLRTIDAVSVSSTELFAHVDKDGNVTIGDVYADHDEDDY